MTSIVKSDYGAERRRHPRVNTELQVEIRTQANQSPSRVVAKDVSLCGCYVETMFTFAPGTRVSLTLWFGEKRISAAAMVVTRHPQVGNGLEFIDMVPEDRLDLNALISHVKAHTP